MRAINHLVLIVSTEIDLGFAWVIETELNSVWGMELSLISLYEVDLVVMWVAEIILISVSGSELA